MQRSIVSTETIVLMARNIDIDTKHKPTVLVRLKYYYYRNPFLDYVTNSMHLYDSKDTEYLLKVTIRLQE